MLFRQIKNDINLNRQPEYVPQNCNLPIDENVNQKYSAGHSNHKYLELMSAWE